MELLFYSLDKDSNKVFFRANYEKKDNLIIFQDKSMENTMIYLTINRDSLVFERKGNTSMTMILKENINTPFHYESSTGLFFDFEVKTKVLSIKDNKLELEYSLLDLGDEIQNVKLWITLDKENRFSNI